MAAYGQPPTLSGVMNPVKPRTGFPVQNQGGIPQTTVPQPAKPFLTSPGVSQGPPGPVKSMAAPGPEPTPGPVPAPAPAPPPPAPPVSPAPMPAPTAPTPAPAPGTSSSSSSGSSGQTGVVSPGMQGNLESQLQAFISQGLGGDTVSKDFINRAKQGVSRNVWGQQRAGEQAINDDAVRRGLFRSGIPAESIAGLRGKSQGAIASGVADILNSAEAQNIQGRQNAAGLGANLLGQNRDWERYQNERADAAARNKGGGPSTWDYIDPETGERTTIDDSWFF